MGVEEDNETKKLIYFVGDIINKTNTVSPANPWNQTSGIVQKYKIKIVIICRRSLYFLG